VPGLQLGRRASRALLLLSLLSATVPLGVKATKRLRNLILRNPCAVDDLKTALARVEERTAIMDALLAPAGGMGGVGGDDLVHVTAEDCVSPVGGRFGAGSGVPVAMTVAGDRGVRRGAIAEVWPESAPGRGGAVAEIGVRGGAVSGAVLMYPGGRSSGNITGSAQDR
jgi:hypothetical protein